MAKGASEIHTQSAPRLLIVDDERTLRFTLREWARDAGFEADEAERGQEALELLRQNGADVVLLDLRLGDEDGLEVLKRLREAEPALPVVMLTGHGGVAQAVQAIRLGAYDFIEKKPPYTEHLAVVLRRALEHSRLKREVEHLRRGGSEERPLIGQSPGLRTAIAKLEKAARSDTATVLLLGETGSGKELMAQFIHARSQRAAGAFIDLNCSAIPEQLLESELFGHEKGAFTDAKSHRKGLMDLADGGTLFLDEIGEMPTALQAKLLRVLEAGSFRRVGGHANISVDVRVIAATHRDLKRLVADGRFREDLYFRLNVVPIEMPPLRERREDVPLLVAHYVERFCRELARPRVTVHPAALEALERYAWPGNVRELKNVIERVILLESEEEIRPEDLPLEISARPGAGRPAAQPFAPGAVVPLADVERMAIEHALDVCAGNKTRAAAQLGISRQTLRTKLKDYRLGDDTDGED